LLSGNIGHKNRLKEVKKQTFLKKYGVENPAQSQKFKEKARQTCLKKYGVENSLSCPEVRSKAKQTMLQRYGVEHCTQNKEISLKAARSCNQIVDLVHWFSRETIPCRGSFELAFVNYCNKNHIDYNWQPQTFLMPSGKTYTPDCYLPDQDLWVEIKGFHRDDSAEKWEWFHKEYPNSEIWFERDLKEKGIL